MLDYITVRRRDDDNTGRVPNPPDTRHSNDNIAYGTLGCLNRIFFLIHIPQNASIEDHQSLDQDQGILLLTAETSQSTQIIPPTSPFMTYHQLSKLFKVISELSMSGWRRHIGNPGRSGRVPHCWLW
jgi:hypothetical protein